MNPDKQRTKIADACGIDITQHSVADFLTGKTQVRYWELPNYTKDLNACHEMEKVLTFHQQATFLNNLAAILGQFASFNEGETGRADFFKMVNSTAAQLCEAFLRCLNLWEEESPENQGGL